MEVWRLGISRETSCTFMKFHETSQRRSSAEKTGKSAQVPAASGQDTDAREVTVIPDDEGTDTDERGKGQGENSSHVSVFFVWHIAQD